MRKTGRYEYVGAVQHLAPDPLPPKDPPFTLSPELAALYGQTMLDLGKLNGMVSRLPDIHRFIKAYVIKEALLSSSIEGIHTTLLEVFTQSLLESKPNKETQLVMNYTKALDSALSLIKNDGLPIVSRVIRQAHQALMDLGEGEKADPGNYRKQSVKVDNLVPPAASHISELMSQLEQFINTDETIPPLIKAGLVHVQFETIHPFLDGNGRIGRLLIVLMLIDSALLTEAMIYPSYYFKKYRFEYYHWLDRVRTEGDFEGWIKFYLTAIKESSVDAYKRVKDIEFLEKQLIQIITQEKRSVKTQDTRLHALPILFSYPIISINELSTQLDISYNTASQIILDFLSLNLLVEENQQKRGKLFKFKAYLEILEKEYYE